MRILAYLLVLLLATPAMAQSYANEPSAIADNFTTDDDLSEDTIGAFPPAAATDEAAARWSCDYSHHNRDDSLLFPGLVGGSAHSHWYAGNTLSDGNSTYSSLRTTGNGTCSGNRINRSSYWFAEWYTDSTHVKKPDGTSLYYKFDASILPGGANAAFYTVTRLPRGFTMIGGSKPGDPTYYDAPPGVTLQGDQSTLPDLSKAHFQCEDGGASSTDITTIDCAAGNRVIVSIDFPACWDGVNLTSATGRTHVTYIVYDSGLGRRQCPDSHPYVITTISQKIYLSHNGPSDYENWWVGSDRMGSSGSWQANWSTIHADYREAWSDEFRAIWEHECNGLTYASVTGHAHSCGDPHVGDGRLFRTDVWDLSETVDAANIIAALAGGESAGPRPSFRLRFRRI